MNTQERYMALEAWRERWAIPPEAIAELCGQFIYTGEADPDASGNKPNSEARVQSEVRLEAASAGVYLFRNNVGAGRLESGNWVRFGLGNDSPALNKVLKSGDLIGVRKRLITAAMVGTYIGQFWSRECKRRDWKWSGTEAEQAQARWATLINEQGGDAAIVNGVGSIQA